MKLIAGRRREHAHPACATGRKAPHLSYAPCAFHLPARIQPCSPRRMGRLSWIMRPGARHRRGPRAPRRLQHGRFDEVAKTRWNQARPFQRSILSWQPSPGREPSAPIIQTRARCISLRRGSPVLDRYGCVTCPSVSTAARLPHDSAHAWPFSWTPTLRQVNRSRTAGSPHTDTAEADGPRDRKAAHGRPPCTRPHPRR